MGPGPASEPPSARAPPICSGPLGPVLPVPPVVLAVAPVPPGFVVDPVPSAPALQPTADTSQDTSVKPAKKRSFMERAPVAKSKQGKRQSIVPCMEPVSSPFPRHLGRCST
ncbi:MAG: hypothetical protein EOO73_18545 [Myxococcales bacterium]|nr:MAG: hypothetical protein EOO73_18545 [Myxococcales bacterium]